MKRKEFATRLNLALDKEGFPPKNSGRIQLLAEMVGMSHRGTSKWVNGEACPPAKKYAALAEKLNVNEAWLKEGKGAMFEELNATASTHKSASQKIPVYTIDSFLSSDKKSVDTVDCQQDNIIGVFAVQLDSEAMSPRFPKNSVIILDEKKSAIDGDFVLVKFDTYPAPIFRQLIIVGANLYLDAHNPKFDRLLLTDRKAILGTTIQAVLSFD